MHDPNALTAVKIDRPETPWTFYCYDPERGCEYSCPVTDEFRADAIARGTAHESDFEPRRVNRPLTADARARLLDLIGVRPSPHLHLNAARG